MQKVEKTTQKSPFIMVAFVVASLLISTPAMAKKKKKKSKFSTIEVYTKAGAPADLYRVPNKNEQYEGRFVTQYGLKSPKGRTLLKTEYRHILQLTGPLVLVVFLDRHMQVYDTSTKSFRPEKWANIDTVKGYYDVSDVATIWGVARHSLVQKEGPRTGPCPDIVLLDEREGKPLVKIRKACSYVGYGNVLIVNFETSSGERSSRLYNDIGMPISPILPQIVQTGSWYYPKHQTLLVLGRLPLADLYDKKLYRPIGRNGEFLPLPKGAVGILNITRFLDKEDHYTQQHSQGTALVYNTKTGFEYSIIDNTAEYLFAHYEGLPRYKSLKNYKMEGLSFSSAHFLMLEFVDGGWTALMTADLTPFMEPGEGKPYYPTYASMIQGVKDVMAERKAAKQAKSDAETARKKQKLREQDERLWVSLQAAIRTKDRKAARGEAMWLSEPKYFMEFVKVFGVKDRDELNTLHRHLNTLGPDGPWGLYNQAKAKFARADARADAYAQQRAQEAAANYQKHLAYEEQLRRAAGREAYKRRHDYLWDADTYGGNTSLHDQTMQNLRDEYQRNLRRINDGGNVYLPKKVNN